MPDQTAGYQGKFVWVDHRPGRARLGMGVGAIGARPGLWSTHSSGAESPKVRRNPPMSLRSGLPQGLWIVHLWDNRFEVRCVGGPVPGLRHRSLEGRTRGKEGGGGGGGGRACTAAQGSSARASTVCVCLLHQRARCSRSRAPSRSPKQKELYGYMYLAHKKAPPL